MIVLNNYFLRALEETDLEWVKNLRNHPQTWPYLGTFRFINSFQQKKWFEKINADETKIYLIFGYKNKNLGLVRLTEIDRINRSMCIGGDILPKERKKGHAKYMYKLIFKLGFEVWGMNRLWLLVLATNDHALRLYKKLGFKEEGKQRKAIFRNGRYIDYIMMSILSEEYLAKY